MKNIFSTLLLSLLICCDQRSEKELILDVTAVVNKKPAEVEEIVGKPDSIYTLRILGKPIFCQLYKRYNIEIQYPEARATDIVIYGPHGLSFNQTALKALNLDYKTNHPDEYIKGQLIRWFDVAEFSTISFYNPQIDSSGNISNFTIFLKAKAPESAAPK